MSRKIIIDGVNVAECSYYNEENKPYCCEIWDNECEAQNCYYKQYLRLKQENEELKKQLEIDKNQINYFIEENEKLKKRCEELDKMTDIFSARLANKYKQALEEIKNLAELEMMLDENSKAFYPTNIKRILDKINEVLNG